MLKKIRITRFKSIFGQSVEFGRVNLFLGPNGAGKSNILEALGVLAAALSGGLEPIILDAKGVRLSLPHLFKSSFRGHKIPITFRLEATFEHGFYTCDIRAGKSSHQLEFATEALFDGQKQVFGRSPHGIKLHSASRDVPSFSSDMVSNTRSVWNVIEPFSTISTELRAEITEFSKFCVYAPQTSVMRGLAIDPRIVEPLGLTGSGLATALLDVLNEIKLEEHPKYLSVIWEPGWADWIRVGNFDSSIVPSQVRSEGKVMYIRDKYMPNGRNLLSPFDASEGTLYLIFVATLLAHSRTPKIFALDNVDGTLNPRLVQRLSSHLIDMTTTDHDKHSRQAFVTSHHPSSLDSFDIFDAAQRVFVAFRSDDSKQRGQTVFKRLQPPANLTREAWRTAHKGQKLSDLLLAGRIEGAL